MKKMLSLLLALPALMGCAAFAEDAADYVGYWVVTRAEIDGETIDPAALGLSAYMELYEDGTCVLAAAEEVWDGTWSVTDTGVTTTDDFGVTVYAYEDGALVTRQEGGTLIFTREEYTLPLSGLSMADFEGDWVLRCVEVGNQYYYPEELAVSMKLSIHNGKGVHTMITAGEDGEETTAVSGICAVEEMEGVGTALVFMYTDATGAQTGSGMVLLMFDNAELVWYAVDSLDRNLFYCFVPEGTLEE